MDIDKIRELSALAIADEGGFLVDLKVSQDNHIMVFADHKDGISLKQLAKISRSIEEHFDREDEDFQIDVSSPGLSEPLKIKEQYEKNVGRDVKVTLSDGKIHKGLLEEFVDDKLKLSWKERVPKEIGKGKMTVTRELVIPLENIKETKLEIRF